MPYNIVIDKLTGNITIKLIGFMDDEEMEEYELEIIEKLREIPDEVDLYLDLSEFRITSDRDLLTRTVRSLSESVKLRRIAISRPRSSIGGLQIKRITNDLDFGGIENQQIFEFKDRKEVLKWLTS